MACTEREKERRRVMREKKLTKHKEKERDGC